MVIVSRMLQYFRDKRRCLGVLLSNILFIFWNNKIHFLRQCMKYKNCSTHLGIPRSQHILCTWILLLSQIKDDFNVGTFCSQNFKQFKLTNFFVRNCEENVRKTEICVRYPCLLIISNKMFVITKSFWNFDNSKKMLGFYLTSREYPICTCSHCGLTDLSW